MRFHFSGPMNAPQKINGKLAVPPPTDLLTQAIEQVRPLLATGSSKQRTHILWAAVKAARDLGASDVVADEFMALAVEVNLFDRRGRWTGTDVRECIRRHGAEHIRHVIAWALRGMNPFEKGPLK
jgi:hypothetical protein